MDSHKKLPIWITGWCLSGDKVHNAELFVVCRVNSVAPTMCPETLCTIQFPSAKKRQKLGGILLLQLKQVSIRIITNHPKECPLIIFKMLLDLSAGCLPLWFEQVEVFSNTMNSVWLHILTTAQLTELLADNILQLLLFALLHRRKKKVSSQMYLLLEMNG